MSNTRRKVRAVLWEQRQNGGRFVHRRTKKFAEVYEAKTVLHSIFEKKSLKVEPER